MLFRSPSESFPFRIGYALFRATMESYLVNSANEASIDSPGKLRKRQNAVFLEPRTFLNKLSIKRYSVAFLI